MKNLNPYVRYINKTDYLPNKQFVIAYDCRFFFVVSGKGEFLTQNNRYELSENNLVYYPSGVPYFIKSDEKDPLVFMSVNFDFTRNLEEIKKTLRPVKLRDFDKSKERPTHLEIDNENFRSCFILENAFFIKDDLLSLTKIFRREDSRLHELCHALLRCVILKIHVQLSAPEKTNEVLDIAINFIEKNFDKEINGKIIAQKLGYHPYYLSSLFKKHLGKTLSEYLLEVRLKFGLDLLIHTNTSVKEIAFKCGFINPEHFSVRFKKTYGTSPLNYRKRNSIV